MATFNVPGVDKNKVMAHTYGNRATAYAKLTLPIGAAAADTCDFIRLPKNVRILDFLEMHDGANSAATTANFGLKGVTGQSVVLDDADYFLAAADLNAAGRNRWGNTAVYPVVLDGEYYVRAVLAGVTTATAAMDIVVIVDYEFIGNL